VNWLILALCAVLLSACGAPRPAPFVFPRDVGAWKLKHVSPAAVPEPIGRLGVTRAESADYEGPGHILAQAYGLTSSAAAVEAEQQWRPQADTVGFHRDSYFFVIHWQNADRNAVALFVREMEKQAGR
jgi:hypothetical protein